MEGREGSMSGQREKLSCDIDPTTVLVTVRSNNGILTVKSLSSSSVEQYRVMGKSLDWGLNPRPAVDKLGNPG